MARFRPAALCRYGNGIILVLLAFYFFLIPFGILVVSLHDHALRDSGIPRVAVRLHRSLSPRYERWARKRIESGAAAKLTIDEISATEWPLFGSVFYLWATESLQEAWEKDHGLSSMAPREYARGAIEAAAALITDPGHASWVKDHWGEEYLHCENVFYRMLLIGGLTSYEKLMGDGKYLGVLRGQVDTLSEELDASPYGLLDDYPGECYPTDVLVAVAIIQRADEVLGTDHSAFVGRSLRAFQGDLLDATGLPPYAANSKNGAILVGARGCGNSYMLTWAPGLWQDKAKEWYADYEKHFWQRRWGAVGFREFPKNTLGGEWYFDVDAGPVVAGHGVAATAFGIGAARANGRFDHAYPMSAEAIVASWPLPDGTLLGARVLSNMADAPFIGETALLFNFTRTPAEGFAVKKGGRLPVLVYCALAFYFGIGALLVVGTVLGLRRWRKRYSTKPIPWGEIQLSAWGVLVAAGIVIGAAYNLLLGVLFLLLARIFPKGEKKLAARFGEQDAS